MAKNITFGAYAIVVMCKAEPNKLVAARKSSPLVLGIGKDNDFYVANLMAAFEKGKQKFNLGFSYSNDIGDHFGTLIWAQNAGGASPNHRFYENKGEDHLD